MANTNKRMNTLSAEDPGVKGTVITGSAQTFDPPGRYLIVSTAGTMTGKLLEDSADVAYVLPAGVHRLAVKSITSVVSLVGCVVA